MRLIRSYKLILFSVSFLVIIGLLIRCQMRDVPVVFLGVIDTRANAIGAINKDMTRKQLIDLLGYPLEVRGIETGKDSNNDYFPGIYAYVNWTTEDKVSSVSFPFGRYKRTYDANFRAVLRLSDSDIILSRDLNWSNVQHLIPEYPLFEKSSSGNKRIKTSYPCLIKGDNLITIVYSKEEYVSLDFSVINGELNNVVYSFQNVNPK